MEFSVFKMLEKVIKSGIQLALSFVAGLGLQNFGVTLDINVATLAIFGALEALRNYLKIKFNLSWI